MQTPAKGRRLRERVANPAWAVLEYGWYPLVLLLATPWFLRFLGTDGYGYWMLLTATVGFGGALSVGTGAATIKAVSAGNGRGMAPERWVRTSIGLAILGGGALAALLLSLYVLAGDSLLGRMGTQPAALRLTGGTAALLLWIEQVDNSISSALKGAERFSDAAKLEIAGKTTQIGLAAFAVAASPGLGTLYAGLVAGALLRVGAKAIAARRLLGVSSLRPSLADARDMLRIAGWGWLQGVGAVLFGVADRMVVGALLGASSLAYYSIASQLAMQVHGISAAALSVVFPFVSRTLETRGATDLRALLRATMLGNLVLGTTLALGLLLVAPFVLDAWIGPTAAAAVRGLLPWLTAAYWLLAVNVAPYYILLGMGRMRLVGTTVLAAGAAGVIAMLWAIRQFGLPGASAGRGVYALVALVLLVPISRLLVGQATPPPRAHAA